MPADVSPSRLAEEYGYRLSELRKSCILSAVLSVAILLLALPEGSLIPFLQGLIPGVILEGLSLALFLVCAFASRDILTEGAVALISKAPDANSLALCAAAFTVLDGASLLLGLRAESMPLCAPCALVLTFRLFAQYCMKKGKRDAAQVAASAPQHYLVTQDTEVFNGKSSLRKWLSVPRGFGSQLRTQSSQDRRFQRLSPVLLIACLVFALLTTVAHHQPRLIFWSLSALFTVSATLSAGLGSDLPFLLLGNRLGKLGAAIAGWPGAQAGKSCRYALLSDFDLYPPGTVTVTAINLYNNAVQERVISLTASILRSANSGLFYPLDQLSRKTRAGYVQLTNLTIEEGGIRAQSQNQEVMVGNSEYMSRMGVILPEGVKSRDVLYCAADKALLGTLTLQYTILPSLGPSLETMINGKLSPILGTRDFNVSPHRLRLRNQFAQEELIFPPLGQRLHLSKPAALHGPDILAILSREGVAPYAQAVVGADRLRRAVRFNGVFTRVSACVGVVLAAVLSSAGALSAMCALSLSLYLLLWTVPVLLLSLWVLQY